MVESVWLEEKRTKDQEINELAADLDACEKFRADEQVNFKLEKGHYDKSLEEAWDALEKAQTEAEKSSAAMIALDKQLSEAQATIHTLQATQDALIKRIPASKK